MLKKLKTHQKLKKAPLNKNCLKSNIQLTAHRCGTITRGTITRTPYYYTCHTITRTRSPVGQPEGCHTITRSLRLKRCIITHSLRLKRCITHVRSAQVQSIQSQLRFRVLQVLYVHIHMCMRAAQVQSAVGIKKAPCR